MVFDNLRNSFDDLIARATKPEERRTVAARMRDTLVQARMGLDDLRSALDSARRRLTVEEKELETLRRRKQLAEGIKDRETAELAAKYEQLHAERVEVLRRKIEAQEAELVLAERDVAQMKAELKAVMSGTDPRAAAPPTLDPADDPTAASAQLGDEIDALGRARARADAEAEADRRLAELKRKMGK